MRQGRRPIVLVTGASGFIGRHLTPALESKGWTVRRAMRTPTGKSNEILVESIGPATDWQKALNDVDAVVHLAARVHHPSEEHAVELYRNINIEGTLHLARCAADVGVRQFIFVSTILVNGRSTDGRSPFSERDVLTPRGVYGMSKAAAESGLQALAQYNGMVITVIRPPLVYGAGAKGNFKLLAQAVTRGVPLPFASIDNRRAFLAVENLSSFVVERLASTQGKFDVFLVADEEQVSTPEFIRRLARAAGVASRLWPMPISVLRPLLKVSGRPEAHDSIIGSLELDVSKVAATGWRPLITLDEGLRHATGGHEVR
jgi:UDP-glucose 4-epimerase